MTRSPLLLGTIFSLLLFACCGGCASEPTARIERLTYGTYDGAYRLSNGTVDVVVIPQIGRIVRYGYIDGPNLLWEQIDAPQPLYGWINHGGDKQWPWPQEAWGWPPPVPIDAGPYTVKVRRGMLLLRSPADPKLGIRAERLIHLAPEGTELTQTYRFFSDDRAGRAARDGQDDRHIGAWAITQVPQPSRVLAHLRSDLTSATTQPIRNHPGKHTWPPPIALDNDWLAFAPIYNGSKIYLPADALGAVIGPTLFLQRRRPDGRDAEVAADVAQLYASSPQAHGQRAPYVEMEFIAPPRRLGRREPSELTVAWTLQPASGIGAAKKPDAAGP